MVKKGRICQCGSSSGSSERNNYPAGIQKEDLLWAYFVMRMICDVLGEPQLLEKIMSPPKEGSMSPFDIAIMCCGIKDPEAFSNAVKAATGDEKSKKTGDKNEPTSKTEPKK